MASRAEPAARHACINRSSHDGRSEAQAMQAQPCARSAAIIGAKQKDRVQLQATAITKTKKSSDIHQCYEL